MKHTKQVKEYNDHVSIRHDHLQECWARVMRKPQSNRFVCLVALMLCGCPVASLVASEPPHTKTSDAGPGNRSSQPFRAGAAAVDISPTEFPVIVSGGFLQQTANQLQDPLHARCLVLDDGTTRIAIVVVDTLLMPRDLLDRAKRLACEVTGIPTDHILIAATHTHSAPSVVGALGTGVDEPYAARLGDWIVESIRLAVQRLAPARVGWGAITDSDHTNCRRWIRRPDRLGGDPFGQQTIRAMMHPGYQNPDYEGPAGPEDPGLSVLAIQASDGRPIAVLANYSMHYFGAAAVSADYYGRFCQIMAEQLDDSPGSHPFVAMMSQGTSGDLHWMDYGQPKKARNIDEYARGVAESALKVYREIEYHDWVSLDMAQRILKLQRRVPDQARLAWARRLIEQMEGRVPRTQAEVYAREQVFLHEKPSRELVLQAIRVGSLGMVAIPSEVYGITGLKIKAQSPLVPTFNFELANGAEGYIPPPEQHFLGGYTTWPARSAGLEVSAEPKIVEAVLGLLEQVSGKLRREPADPSGPYPHAVIASRPIAYWRLAEMSGELAADSSGNGNVGTYEPGVAFFLEGPDSSAFCGGAHTNRAAHFAGGRVHAKLPQLGDRYSVELWFWNALPSDARPVTGYLISRGQDGVTGAPGDHLGIGGNHQDAIARGRLFVYNGDVKQDMLVGHTTIALRSWHHLVLIRDQRNVAVYLDGQAELTGQLEVGHSADVMQVFVGGRSDHLFGFEGKIDELAIFDRPLTLNEILTHYRAAGVTKDVH